MLPPLQLPLSVAILNRLLDGLRVWLDHGLQEPDDVVRATAEYRAASDPLGRFLSTCVVTSVGDRVHPNCDQRHERCRDGFRKVE